MNFPFAPAATAAALALVFASPVVAGAADQQDMPPAEATQSEATASEAPASETVIEVPPITPVESGDETAEEQQSEAEERICRRVALETSSRRKTRVCLTRQGWRELNNPR